MAENEAEDQAKQEDQQKPKPNVTVDIGTGPKMRPTFKLNPPKGGWNPSKHQQEKKPVGRSKSS